MTWHIVINFDRRPENPTGKVWHFGEELWRACRDGTDGWASISLDEVEPATDQFRVAVGPACRVRRIAKAIERLLEKHFLDRCARISVTNAGD